MLKKRPFLAMIVTVVALLLLSSIEVKAQRVVLRNNLLYDAALTPNLGFDISISEKWTLGANIGYRPWPTDDHKTRKWRHLLIAPELRHWNDSVFAHKSSYWGLNLIYSHYNVANVKFPFGMYREVRDHRLEGDLWGVGVFYGYTWRLNRTFRLEVEGGIGAGLASYDKYECGHCGTKIGDDTKPFLIPKLVVNIVLDPRKKEKPEPVEPIEPVVTPTEPVETPTEPVVTPPEPTVAEALALSHPVLRDYSEYKPYDKNTVLRKQDGMLYVHFPLDKSVLIKDFRGNEKVLDEIVDVTRQIRDDQRSEIRVIQIIGLASIEGNSAHNQQLSEERAAALRSYIMREVDGLSPTLFETVSGGEAWTEFRDQLNDALLSGGAGTSLTVQQLQKAINIIDTESNPDVRERKLRNLEKGQVYKALAKDFLADQRNSGYLRIYYSKK